MPKPLTTQATLACSSQGPVTIGSSGSKLQVGNQKVLVKGDWPGAPPWSVKCPIPPKDGGCTMASGSPTAGVSTKLFVGAQGVLLDTLSGPSSSAHTIALPKGGSAGQSKLEVAS